MEYQQATFPMDDDLLLREMSAEARRRGYQVITLHQADIVTGAVYLLGIMVGILLTTHH